MATATDMTMTSVSTALMAMNTSSMGMSSMPSMDGMDMSCRISMLWNWFTIDACFLSSSWHIRSHGMFAGSCIATICLVLCLEFLRRMGREYDAFILRRAHSAALASKFPAGRRPRRVPSFFLSNGQKCSCDCPIVDGSITAASTSEPSNAKLTGPNNITPVAAEAVHSINGGVANRKTSEHLAPYRPSPVEQVIRALLHMVQFAVAYFIMLLAMYYNGYIIICIFIGAFLGSLIFSWEPLSLSKENDATQVTKCCG